MSSFNNKFISKKRKMIGENEDETTENILEEHINIKNQIEILSRKQNYILEKNRKEREEDRENFTNLIKNMQLNIDLLKLKREKDKKRIYDLRKYIDDLDYKHREYRQYINHLLIQRKEDQKKIDDLIFQNL